MNPGAFRHLSYVHTVALWKHAWQSLAMHRLRSLLSTLGIVFAVMAVVAMLAIAEGARVETMKQIRGLGINNILIRQTPLSDLQREQAGRRQVAGLGTADMDLLEKLPGVAEIAAIREIRADIAELGETEAVPVLAVTAAYKHSRSLKMGTGRFIADLDVDNRHLVCVLGSDLSRRLGSAGSVNGVLHISGAPHRIVGILQSREAHSNRIAPVAFQDFNNTAFIPIHPAAEAGFAGQHHGALSEIIISMSEPHMVGPAAESIRRVLQHRRGDVDDVQLIIPRELLRQARQTQQLFNVVLGSIAGISLLVGGIGIMNIMLANVSERRREIGIRRAVGASRRHILYQFLTEAVLLTGMGGAGGVILGMLVALGIDLFVEWPTAVSLWAVAAALAMSAAVGIASGLFPAWTASRVDPAEALRQI
jgi:putative ABC transport system permease protein